MIVAADHHQRRWPALLEQEPAVLTKEEHSLIRNHIIPVRPPGVKGDPSNFAKSGRDFGTRRPPAEVA